MTCVCSGFCLGEVLAWAGYLVYTVEDVLNMAGKTCVHECAHTQMMFVVGCVCSVHPHSLAMLLECVLLTPTQSFQSPRHSHLTA